MLLHYEYFDTVILAKKQTKRKVNNETQITKKKLQRAEPVKYIDAAKYTKNCGWSLLLYRHRL